ncbi:hypothetical protein [Methylobacterium sp. WSM2598]|uniref:hypothetical protein n=1 Tax=Methylobacterium sp. WSM2598 TaxID=398261 RepID=UPI00036501F5|nr:hypothetical protein [Methylobacterium sp. WSM2598]
MGSALATFHRGIAVADEDFDEVVATIRRSGLSAADPSFITGFGFYDIRAPGARVTMAPDRRGGASLSSRSARNP